MNPLRHALVVVLFGVGLVAAAPAAAAAQPPPLAVEADQITYDESTQTVEAEGNVRLRYRDVRLSAEYVVVDLQREHLTATGRVILVDASGRELRGSALRYDARLNLAEVRQAETRVDRVFIRSELLQQQPAVITATDTMLTPCDPARPLVRLTARRIELYPGDRLIATHASLWVGATRVFTLPVYTVSLRSAEETAKSFPRIGASNADGLWAQYTYAYPLGLLQGALLAKVGTRSGLILRNTLTYQRDPVSIDLTVGRNQDAELRLFDQAEVAVALAERPPRALPVFYTLELRSGWLAEVATGNQTSRTQYTVGLRLPPRTLAPGRTLAGGLTWSDAFYGTGDRQGIIRADIALRQELSDRRSVSLSYTLLEALGSTPFLLDAIEPADRTHKATLLFGQSGTRGAAFTVANAGVAYDFRARAPSLILGYGERHEARYHWGITAEYNLSTTDTALTVGTGRSIGFGTYATVQAIYHTLTGAFEELDFILSSRVCDCFDVALIYRQARQELWLEIGLAPIPPSRLPLFFPRP